MYVVLFVVEDWFWLLVFLYISFYVLNAVCVWFFVAWLVLCGFVLGFWALSDMHLCLWF